jgi:Domain of unknown function (DUF6457)
MRKGRPVDDWIDRFADALGVARVSPKEMGALLKISREVAHRVERKDAPLSTYLAGLYVGKRTVAGETSDGALQRAIEEALSLIPEQPA